MGVVEKTFYKTSFWTMALIILVALSFVYCVNSLCISSKSSSFIAGEYHNVGRTLSSWQSVYKLQHVCGSRYLYFNTRFNKLVIAEEVSSATEGSLSFYAMCNDEDESDPLLCTGWNSNLIDLTVSNDGCDALCGHNGGSCSPKPLLRVTNSPGSRKYCNGEFEKMNYMDVYVSDVANGFYWSKHDDMWQCTRTLPTCDGSSWSVLAQMTDAEMNAAMECEMREPMSCVGTGQAMWSKDDTVLIGVYMIIAMAFLGIGIVIGSMVNQHKHAKKLINEQYV